MWCFLQVIISYYIYSKNWVSSMSLGKVSDNAFVNIGYLQVNQLTTESEVTLYDNCCMKHHWDLNNKEEISSTEEVIAHQKKVSLRLKFFLKFII